MKLSPSTCAVLMMGAAAAVPAARADLQTLGIWNGNVGLSIDAVGSNSSPVGNVQANIPVGSTVLAAYLYSAGVPSPFYSSAPTTLAAYNSAGITLAGNAVTNFSALVGASAIPARPDLGNWFTARADVTSIVQSLAVGGPNYNWSVGEGPGLNGLIDGEVLAIVYSNAALPTGSVVLLNGGMNTSGETTTVNLGAPLGDVTAPGFFADMSLGISFSTGNNGQTSQVNVNGTRLTSSAGGFDDGGSFDGGLITAGGIGDSNANPSSPSSTSSPDDELYNLVPFLATGATSFTINTLNPSNDDNIFFLGMRISANVTNVDNNNNRVPDGGATVGLLALALSGLAAARRRFARS